MPLKAQDVLLSFIKGITFLIGLVPVCLYGVENSFSSFLILFGIYSGVFLLLSIQKVRTKISEFANRTRPILKILGNPWYLAIVALILAVLLLYFTIHCFWAPKNAPQIDPKNDESIAIIGAGPGGLSVAYYLKENGYHNVTLFEKEPRIGGQCFSISYKYRSFDVGANYITPAYSKIMALAKKYGSVFYTGPGTAVFNRTDHQLMSQRQFAVTRAPWISIFIASIKYYLIRVWISYTTPIDTPGFKDIHLYPSLTVSFYQWLENHGLLVLAPVFEQPITMMGYGYLQDIPAPHALKYMSPKTFINLALVVADYFEIKYPYRFLYGFQRFWERIAVDFTIETSANISAIIRAPQTEGGKVTVKYRSACEFIDPNEDNQNWDEEQDSPLDSTDENEGGDSSLKIKQFDKVVLAVPLTLSNLQQLGLDLSEEETEIFNKVTFNPYTMTTWVLDATKTDQGAPSFNSRKVYSVVPYNNQTIGTPWAVVKQYEENQLFQFYTMATQSSLQGGFEQVKEDTMTAVKKTMETLNVGAKVPENEKPRTFDLFTYFPHPSVEDMKDGFYAKLEALQGQRSTYYAGSLMAFHLVEPITEYSEALVNKFFPKDRTLELQPIKSPSPQPQPQPQPQSQQKQDL